MEKHDIDAVTGLSAQDAAALGVLCNLLEKDIVSTKEVHTLVQAMRVDNVRRLCKTKNEQKALDGILSRVMSSAERERKEHTKKRRLRQEKMLTEVDSTLGTVKRSDP